jgi:hypothetical protein
VTKDDEIRRGQRAEAILKDPLYIEAWEAINAQLAKLMVEAKTDEATLEAKKCIGLLADMRQHFGRILYNGRHAAEQIKFEEEAKKQKRWWAAA